MRVVATVALLGTALVSGHALATLGAAPSALIAIAIAVLLAGLASEGYTPTAISFGAIGALTHAALTPVSLELAGAALVTAVFAARALRGRTPRARGLLVLASLVGGGAAAWIATQYGDGGPAVRAAAALVAGVLGSAALLMPADDVATHALVSLSGEIEGPSRTVLLRAAFLRRRNEGPPEGLSTRAARRLERAWDALVDTGRSRLAASGNTAALLDRRIAAHVDALERLYSAADERLARATGLNDRVLDAARSESEALEAEVSALAEVGALDHASRADDDSRAEAAAKPAAAADSQAGQA